MKTFAVLREDGLVTSLILANSKESAETTSGKSCAEYFLVEPGWTYANGTFSPPA
jgi:hypothetical protein